MNIIPRPLLKGKNYNTVWVYADISNLLFISLWMTSVMELNELHELRNIHMYSKWSKDKKSLVESKLIIISQQTILDFILLSRLKNECGQ